MDPTEASFDGEKHAINLPSVNSASFVLRFLEKLCHSLQCDNLFSSQPFSPYMGCAHSPTEYDRNKPAKEEIPENGSAKRYSQDSPPYTAPLSPKLPRSDAHPSEGDYIVLFTGLVYRISVQTNDTSFLNILTPKAASSTTGPDLNSLKREPSRMLNKDPSTWSIEEVMRFVKEADPQALAPHAELFRRHEIDGKALLLLRSDMIMKYMGLKLGPALKLCYHIERLKQGKY
ncbi:UNVERIFIED_CONTAM: hypothetical protein H355_012775 [Colinus virginianus]|nr:hypothetical protein H355_012775 [Colinus virginianus]